MLDKLEAWLEEKRTGGMIPCWTCLKLVPDMGADRQFCSQKCLDAWAVKDKE